MEGITNNGEAHLDLFIAVDGVAEIDPDWHFPYFDENMGRAVGEDYNTSDVLLLGRETYDSFERGPAAKQRAGTTHRSPGNSGTYARSWSRASPSNSSWRNSEPIDGDHQSRHRAEGRPGHHWHPRPRLDISGAAAAHRGACRRAPAAGTPGSRTQGPQALDDGDTPYHLALIATEVFPTG